jgi:hypothetical protein
MEKQSPIDSAKWNGTMGRSLVVAVASYGFDDRATHVKWAERLGGLLKKILRAFLFFGRTSIVPGFPGEAPWQGLGHGAEGLGFGCEHRL